MKEEFHGDFQLYAAKWNFDHGNIKHLTDLLNSDEELTERTRAFIADVLTGKVKCKVGRPRDPELDMKFFYFYQEKRDSGLTHEEASVEAELVFQIPAESAIKKFQKLSKQVEKQIEVDRVRFLEAVKKNPELFEYFLNLPEVILSMEKTSDFLP